ncbi:YkgJ family cysteine cluster protein [Pseudomonas sp. UYIF39]|nr:YkgJ family cysteine cluster protein [Pseudomonas sp. UYIF39]MDI3356287.1 YkgJ family cysteine cluster protein [Pseudomonas sp. UYIF39]
MIRRRADHKKATKATTRRCGLRSRAGAGRDDGYLDRGDGACRHYSDANKHCLIYETRPDICRVDRQYRMHYAQRFSWEAFVEVNVEVCRLLQSQEDG